MGLVGVVIDAHIRVRYRQLHHLTRILFLLPWETISIPPKTLRVSEHCYSLAISVENRSSIFSGMSGDTGPHLPA